jgi:hypothetical protein
MEEAVSDLPRRGNWIVTHVQMLTFVIALCGAGAAAVAAIAGGALYLAHEAAAIAELERQVTALQNQNYTMADQINSIWCRMAGSPNIPTCKADHPK